MLTGELDGEARFADEVVTVELEREDVEGAVRVLREEWATPLFQQDAILSWAVPHFQDVMVHFRVEDDEVEATHIKNTFQSKSVWSAWWSWP